MDLVKTCSKCKHRKPFSSFHKNGQQTDGLHPSCKECRAICGKDYRQRNKEKISSVRRAAYAANSQAIKDRVNTYRINNREKVCARKAAYYQKNSTRLYAKSRSYAAQNPEKVGVYKAKYKTHQRLSLGDCYIRELLIQGTLIKNVPQTLIDLKRVQVLITRKLKELKDDDRNRCSE